MASKAGLVDGADVSRGPVKRVAAGSQNGGVKGASGAHSSTGVSSDADGIRRVASDGLVNHPDTVLARLVTVLLTFCMPVFCFVWAGGFETMRAITLTHVGCVVAFVVFEALLWYVTVPLASPYSGINAFAASCAVMLAMHAADIAPASAWYDHANWCGWVHLGNVLGLLVAWALYATASVRGTGLRGFYAGVDMHPCWGGIDVKLFIASRLSMMGWGLLALARVMNAFEQPIGITVSSLLIFLYLVRFFFWEQGYVRARVVAARGRPRVLRRVAVYLGLRAGTVLMGCSGLAASARRSQCWSAVASG
jgi:hypothetical protein